jgi:hypothetical protein
MIFEIVIGLAVGFFAGVWVTVFFSGLVRKNLKKRRNRPHAAQR